MTGTAPIAHTSMAKRKLHVECVIRLKLFMKEIYSNC